MKHLKKVGLAVMLMLVLASAALAGETNSPPAAALCAPGETNSPPCIVQPVNDDPTVPGETGTPPAAPIGVTDLAETLLWSLLLF